MSPYRLPDVSRCGVTDCRECAELAAAMDADLAARLRVLAAAQKADRRHALNRVKPTARPGGK